MGRNKIDIKKQPKSQRTNTFKKRSEGIKMKAKELSIISDVQVLLLLRTPMGKYHLFQENSSFDGIVQRFLSETQENREDSRVYGMKNPRKSFKSDIHALNAISLMDHGTGSTDSQEMQLKNIKIEVSKLESQLGSLRYIHEIDKLEKLDELTTMENSIMELLAMNDQQARMESNSTACGDERCFTINAAGPNSGAASQSRVPPSLARNNPPMPLISTNYAGSMVNAGFDRRFHSMLEPAPPPPLFTDPHPYNDQCQYQVVEDWEPQQYYPAMANDYEAGPSNRQEFAEVALGVSMKPF